MPKGGVWFLSPEPRSQEVFHSQACVCARAHTLHTLGLDSRAQDPLRQVWPAALKETGFSFLAPQPVVLPVELPLHSPSPQDPIFFFLSRLP